MKRLLGLSAVGIVLAGCQSSESPTTAEVVPVTVVRKVVPVGAPTSTNATKIALVVRKGPVITVGYPSPSKAFDSFRDPNTYGSEHNDLPARFEYPYRARSWETAHRGFGEILYDGDLVAAMFHEDELKQERVDEIVQEHRDQLGGVRPDNLITAKRVTYWFWKVDNQRLMICAFQKDQRGIELTVAMGDDVVMDALGISPEQAAKDAASVDAATTKGPMPKATSAQLRP